MRRFPRIPGEAVRIGASTFAGGGVTLQYYLPWLVIGSYDSVAHVFTFVPKVIGVNDLPNLQVNIAPGEAESYPVFPFQSVSIDTSTANAIYFYSDAEVPGSNTPVKIQGNQTLVETEGGTATQAAPTASGILKAGSNTIPVGALIDYCLSLNSANLTAQLWLQGHTATTPGPSVFGGQTLSGNFVKTTADTLDVWISVGAGNAEPYSYFWQATAP